MSKCGRDVHGHLCVSAHVLNLRLRQRPDRSTGVQVKTNTPHQIGFFVDFQSALGVAFVEHGLLDFCVHFLAGEIVFL
jgi:hypothetical protein